MKLFVGGPAHTGFGGGKNLDEGQKTIGWGVFGESGNALPDFGREALAPGLGVNLVNEKGPNGVDELLKELGEVFSGCGEVVETVEEIGGVFLKDGLNQAGDGLAGGETEDLLHIVFLNVFATEGDELIEHGLSVPHAAIGPFGNGPGGGFVEIDAFLGGNMEQLLGDDVGGDGPEVEALAARDDGGEDFIRLGGREDELHVRGGLLEGLEKGVEGRIREHVDLIDVVNLERGIGGSVLHRLAELADLLDAIVGRTIDFEDIERVSFRDFHQLGVIGVKIDGGAARIVERFRENTGSRGFTGATGAYEEVSVGETALFDGVAKGADDVILPQNIFEGAGTIFAGKNLIAQNWAEFRRGARQETTTNTQELCALVVGRVLRCLFLLKWQNY